MDPLPPLPPSFYNLLDRRHTGRQRKRDNLLMGEGREGGWGGDKDYGGDEAWYVFNTLCMDSSDYYLMSLPIEIDDKPDLWKHSLTIKLERKKVNF